RVRCSRVRQGRCPSPGEHRLGGFHAPTPGRTMAGGFGGVRSASRIHRNGVRWFSDCMGVGHTLPATVARKKGFRFAGTSAARLFPDGFAPSAGRAGAGNGSCERTSPASGAFPPVSFETGTATARYERDVPAADL